MPPETQPDQKIWKKKTCLCLYALPLPFSPKYKCSLSEEARGPCLVSVRLSSTPSRSSSERGAAVNCDNCYALALKRWQVWDGGGDCDLREFPRRQGGTQAPRHEV
uniref:Uncharacterized protein n=1 Tax=Colobus angolensis palliatus TaxID=336983 RepID=A0A2K5H7U4_COLAP